MKKRRILLALLAMALSAVTALPAATAYFTPSTSALGGRTLWLGGGAGIEETYGEWQKTAVISAVAPSQPLYVRARAYSKFPLSYKGDGWTDGGDGWWYYEMPLANYQGQPDSLQKSAGPLIICIEEVRLALNEKPAGFEVPVVYETAPVQYNENGERLPCTDPAIWGGTVVPAGSRQGGGDAG